MLSSRARNDVFTITGKVSSRASPGWLKVPTSAMLNGR